VWVELRISRSFVLFRRNSGECVEFRAHRSIRRIISYLIKLFESSFINSLLHGVLDVDHTRSPQPLEEYK